MTTRREKTRAAASLKAQLVLKNKKADFDIACDM